MSCQVASVVQWPRPALAMAGASNDRCRLHNLQQPVGANRVWNHGSQRLVAKIKEPQPKPGLLNFLINSKLGFFVTLCL